MYNVQCTIYTVQCTLYNVHCTCFVNEISGRCPSSYRMNMIIPSLIQEDVHSSLRLSATVTRSNQELHPAYNHPGKRTLEIQTQIQMEIHIRSCTFHHPDKLQYCNDANDDWRIWSFLRKGGFIWVAHGVWEVLFSWHKDNKAWDSTFDSLPLDLIVTGLTRSN